MSEDHSKMEEGSLNGTLQDTHIHKVESLSQDEKVVVEIEKGSLSETPDVDIVVITDEEQVTQNEENSEEQVVESSKKMEETEEDVPESVADTVLKLSESSSPDESAHQVDNTLASGTVELELKEDTITDRVEETELPPSEDNNEGLLRETEVIETIREMNVTEEEEENVLSSAVTNGEEPSEINDGDVVSKEVLETSDPKSDENNDKVPQAITGEVPKGIEESLALPSSTDEKVGEQSDVQESPSYDSAKESFQPSPPNVPDAESTSATEQERTEEPRSTENPVGNSHFIIIISYRHFSLCLASVIKFMAIVVIIHVIKVLYSGPATVM